MRWGLPGVSSLVLNEGQGVRASCTVGDKSSVMAWGGGVCGTINNSVNIVVMAL